MHDHLEPYIYQPLPPGHVRLLHISAPSQSGKLNCTLESVPLAIVDYGKEIMRYEALSYAWGSLEHTFSLNCDGRELRVHQNLYSALPYLATRQSNQLPIWIDAICINQDDETEKLLQIRLMSEIYKKAVQVIVWLGESATGDQGAARLAITEILGRMHERDFWEFKAEEDHRNLFDLGFPAFESPAWTEFEGLITSDWFCRLWVIQEFSLADRVQFTFGGETIDYWYLWRAAFSSLSALVRIIQRTEPSFRPQLISKISGYRNQQVTVFRNRIQYHSKLNDYAGNESHLFNTVAWLLCESFPQKCSDPRDRVFSLLGFLGTELSTRFKFDEKTPLDELYPEFLSLLLINGGDVSLVLSALFHYAINHPKSVTKLPSWCVDFHHIDFENHNIGRMMHYFTSADTASRRENHIRRGKSFRELVLRGRIFDEIGWLGDAMPTYSEDRGQCPWRWYLDFHKWDIELAQILMSPKVKSRGTHITHIFSKITSSLHLASPYSLELSDWEYGGALVHASHKIKAPVIGDFLEFREWLAKLSKIAASFESEVEFIQYIDSNSDGFLPSRMIHPELPDVIEYFRDQHSQRYRERSVIYGILHGQQDRRPFITKKRHLTGFVSGPHVQYGDIMSVIDGTKIFHVLRKSVDCDNRDAYILVGDAFIVNYGRGEMDNVSWAKDLKDQLLTLV